ncbi:type-F conjugative transfer system protein TraW [Serratia plymuthica A30]|uniref:type-F conjugative transfer system protein TraW n=1 Tax=Serratia plymuthica TaxID=82996 RepID=UPI0002A3F525|nr:type-F conjugative transfer system protein TraW [Serratia plymuthica]EKF67014.1 type-F conjugative transfer system protein TraW [Serratia plymuthica A30]
MKLAWVMGLIIGLTGPVYAANLGVKGALFPIAEQDMVDFIKQRLTAMEQSGELAQLQKETEERVKEHAVRPTPVDGLSPTQEAHTFYYDPTFVVGQTITDMAGNVIALKGQRVNPLHTITYDQTLYFIDGDDKEQMSWIGKAIKGQSNFKVILVNGNVKKTSDALDEPVYFDQHGSLTQKFGFKHVPARIAVEGDRMRIDEIKLGTKP